MVSDGQKVIAEVGDREIPIEPIKVRDLPAFTRAVKPVAEALKSDDQMAALIDHVDQVIECVRIGAGVDKEWLDDQEINVLIELAALIIEVNADFFARKVAPMIARVADRVLAEAEEATPTQDQESNGTGRIS